MLEANKIFLAAINKYVDDNAVANIEKKVNGQDFVVWGDKNDYPKFLWELYSNCTTLQTIINGIGDYVGTHNCYIKEQETVGKDRYNKPEYKAHIKAAIYFDENAPRCECFHNYRELNGGTHLEAVKSKITNYVNWFLNRNGTKFEAAEKITNNLMENLVVVIESNCSQNSTVWTNGACDAIANTMIADIAGDLIDGDFIHFLEKVKMPL